MLRLLLEGVHNPQPLPELQRVDRPIRIGAVLEHHLEYTGADTMQRLGDVGLLAFGRDRQRPQDPILRPFWKADERLAGRLDPREIGLVISTFHVGLVSNISPDVIGI